ncbi:4158_t:CDS:2 [Cetraspora pellucida]|uniref:4158_t:CDS:1 n=1 Tax=Cetraspora pellucida TaxID=1433469 RepID=A0A9N9FR04_9GLOM|nr:4158_t:CDS:2 [Cetraspora pellucida]
MLNLSNDLFDNDWSLKQTPKIHRAKSCQKKPTKVLKSDSFLKLSSNDNEKKDLKQEQDVKLDAKNVLKKLTNDYLEGLKFELPEPKFASNGQNNLGYHLGIEVDKVEQEPNEQVKDKDELEDLIDKDSNDDNDDNMIWDEDDDRNEIEEDKNKQIGVKKGEQNGDKKDECNKIRKDECIGVKKDKRIRIDKDNRKVIEYFQKATNMGRLPPSGHSLDSCYQTRKWKKIEKLKSLNFRSLEDACDDWNRRVKKLKVLIKETRKLKKFDETHLKPCDQQHDNTKRKAIVKISKLALEEMITILKNGPKTKERIMALEVERRIINDKGMP